MMKWIKKGMIFNPTDHTLPNGCYEFAQSPQAMVFDDFVRVYFSTRAKDPFNGKYLSHIAFADYNRDMNSVISVSASSVIELGGLGCFDEHGIFPINPLRVKDKIYAYTCGWSRRISVSIETATGLAISEDNGITFKKHGTGPVFASSLHEPVLVGDSFVQLYEDGFHMWYIFGTCWLPPQDQEPPARIYKIGYAFSTDGKNWNKKEEGKQIIANRLGAEECQALPTVLKTGLGYHMYFCYRHATDFRKNQGRGYRLGYAFSEDGKTWSRNDDAGGIGLSENGWDSEMMCYPHIFQCGQKIYLLYNGNEFGRLGFGLAELQPS